MFNQLHSDRPIPYESYQTIFNGNLNISSGYPQTDTCSTCTQYLSKIKCLENKLSNKTDVNEQKRLKTEELRNFTTVRKRLNSPAVKTEGVRGFWKKNSVA